MGRTRDALSTRIKAIDKKLAGTPIKAEECSIFKVHEQLPKVNEKAYKPVLLAIGPYIDHCKVGHGFMEEHKLRYLKQMLQRRNERSVKDYISALSDLDEIAWKCYAERINLKKDEFVEMMLLDGCFIIELFRRCETVNLRDKHDPIFQMNWMLAVIARDLILFENQLPYFVLTKLFEMSASDKTSLPNPSIHSGKHIVDIEQKYEITRLESSISIYQSVQTRRLSDFAIYFFIDSLATFQDWDGSSSYSTEKIRHLLCGTHTAITPPLAKIVHEHLKVGDKFKNADFKHLLDLIHTIIRLSILDMELHHATLENQEVGVKFKKGEIFKDLFDPIHGVVSALLEKMEKMKGFKKMNELQKYRSKFNMPEIFKRLHGQKRIEDWKTIPYGTELHEAGAKFKMAKKFRDKLKENRSWNSIPDAIAFQDAGVELKKAEMFLDLLADQNYRNEDGKSKLCGAIFKMVERFMRLPCLNKFENWNSIPHGTKLKEAGVEFKKAKTFTNSKNMIRSNIPNATELKEGAVKFKKAKQRTTFTKFSNGVLEISPLRIEDETETFWRNLIAHEQYSPHNDTDTCYVTNYVCFMDDLIDSPKDVELLHRKRIIENRLGDDEVASTMVNKLGHHVTISTSNSIYAKTSLVMNKDCAKRWNERKAKLRHNYFHSPWALLSVLAAILLLASTCNYTDCVFYY